MESDRVEKWYSTYKQMKETRVVLESGGENFMAHRYGDKLFVRSRS